MRKELATGPLFQALGGAGTLLGSAAPPRSDRPEVVVFFIDAGGGHRNAAMALVAAAEEHGCAFRFTPVSLQDVLAPLDFTRRLTGLPLEETYNVLLRRRWTGFLVPLLRAFHLLVAGMHGRLVRAVAAELERRRPSAVVSVMPNFNAVLRDAVRAVHPAVPFVVLMTDYADFPPHFWIEPGVDVLITGSAEGAEQAKALGVAEDRICRVSGMLLHPRFNRPRAAETRALLRGDLGIPEDAFVVLLLFGGKGSPVMEPLCERLLAPGSPAWHVVAIAGENPGLRARLTALAAREGGRLHPVGFTDRVADYLSAADLLITKPGPGSLAEAFHMKVPVIATRDRYTVPQERFNTRMLEDQGLGIAVRDWRDAPGAAARLARDPAALERLRRNLQSLPPNRALEEVLAIVGERVGDGRPVVTPEATIVSS